MPCDRTHQRARRFEIAFHDREETIVLPLELNASEPFVAGLVYAIASDGELVAIAIVKSGQQAIAGRAYWCQIAIYLVFQDGEIVETILKYPDESLSETLDDYDIWLRSLLAWNVWAGEEDDPPLAGVASYPTPMELFDGDRGACAYTLYQAAARQQANLFEDSVAIVAPAPADENGEIAIDDDNLTALLPVVLNGGTVSVHLYPVEIIPSGCAIAGFPNTPLESLNTEILAIADTETSPWRSYLLLAASAIPP